MNINKTISLFLLSIVLSTNIVSAKTMFKNDFITGSDGFKKDEATWRMPIKNKYSIGIAGGFYKNSDEYHNSVFSAKLPFFYVGTTNLVELTPFVYSKLSQQSAYGAKLSLTTAISQKEESMLYVSLTAAAASQKAKLTTGDYKNFTETAFSLQVEKDFYQKFKLSMSASGFLKPSSVSNKQLVNPVLDHGDMIDLAISRQLNQMPEWVLSTKISRNFRPDFDSLAFVKYSKISLRSMDEINSYTAGMEFGLNKDNVLEVSYNYFKENKFSAEHYYKIIISTMF